MVKNKIYCRLCNSGDTRRIGNYIHCNNCSFGFIYNIKNTYFEKSARIYLPKILSNILERSNINNIKKRLTKIERLTSKGKILDIGCAGGTFLKIAKERGWETYGIEPFKQEFIKAKEVIGNVENVKLEDYNTNTKFDVITLFDVIEHFESLEPLSKINKLLKEGGLLVVSCMDASSLNFRLTGKRWSCYQENQHFNYFNKKTMKLLFKNLDLIHTHIENNKLKHFISYPFYFIFFLITLKKIAPLWDNRMYFLKKNVK